MTEYHERESMDFDVVVVGGGPSGLATACRLMQLAKEKNSDLSIVVVEKGSENTVKNINLLAEKNTFKINEKNPHKIG